MGGLALLQGLPEPGILLFQAFGLVQQALKLFFLSLEYSQEQNKTEVLVTVAQCLLPRFYSIRVGKG